MRLPKPKPRGGKMTRPPTASRAENAHVERMRAARDAKKPSIGREVSLVSLNKENRHTGRAGSARNPSRCKSPSGEKLLI